MVQPKQPISQDKNNSNIWIRLNVFSSFYASVFLLDKYYDSKFNLIRYKGVWDKKNFKT